MQSFQSSAVVLVLSATLSGCFVFGNHKDPIATKDVPARSASAQRDVVVVLPGFGADIDVLIDNRVPEVMGETWPEADIVLTSATFAYYSNHVLVQRLQADVLEPLASRNYRDLWLAGASLGGLGAMLYERDYPGVAAGIILFSPFLGDGDLHEEIQAAGGIAHWEPGARPERVDGDNYQREIWRVVKDWSKNPEQARRIWLVCGRDDDFLESVRLMAPAIPADQYLEVDGGHTWDVWLDSARQVMGRIRAKAQPTAPGP